MVWWVPECSSQYIKFTTVALGHNDGGDYDVEEEGYDDEGKNRRYFWRECYKNAHINPHDLWFTHWNYNLPTTGIGAG